MCARANSTSSTSQSVDVSQHRTPQAIEPALDVSAGDVAVRQALENAGLLDALETFCQRMNIRASMRQIWDGLTDIERSRVGVDFARVSETMNTLGTNEGQEVKL